MAKKLVHNYTFTPSSNTVVIDAYVSGESLLLITNTTSGIILYNFADPALGAASLSYNSSTNKTTVVLEKDCSAMSSADNLQIFLENGSQEIEPTEMLYDPVNKFRVSEAQALIDTDFEYGNQITKWENLALVNNRPFSFVSQNQASTGISTISSMTMTPGQRVVTVNLVANSPRPGIGTAIVVQDTNLPFANGTYVVDTTPSATQFTYRTRTVNTTAITSIFDSNKTGIYTGTPYTNAGFGTCVVGVTTSVGTAVTITTPVAHGLSLGNQVVLVGSAATIINGTQHVAAIGSTNSFVIYTDTIPGAATTFSTIAYVKPSGTFIHRAVDGGVIFSTNANSNYEQTIRQTRRYFRYQSGKGVQISSGTCLRPNLTVDSITSIGVTVTVTTKDFHNIQRIPPGTSVTIAGCNESAYNGTFNVEDVLSFNKFTYHANSAPSATVASGTPTVSVTSWYGAVNRLGMFDQQNGVFFEFNGQHLYAVKRSSTFQIPGRVTVAQGSVTVSQTSSEFPTFFTKNLQIGDFIVIKGQSYRVIEVTNDTNITISPAYRGPSTDNVTALKTIDTKVPQSDWNIDKADGTGKSGYNVDLSRMQMFYIDYSWYGAGFIRWGLRGTDGNVFYVHKMKNNNVNTEAYMRSGNLPARYESSTEPPASVISSSLGAADTTVGIASTAGFPPQGTIVVKNANTIEYMNYVGVGTTGLSGLVRAKSGERAGLAITCSINSCIISVASTTNIQVGQRIISRGFPDGAFVASIGAGNSVSITGAASTNLVGVAATFVPMAATTPQTFTYSATDPVAVELAFPTFAPTISHWGTSVIMDGRFDDDKSLIFTFGQTTVTSINAGLSRALFSIRVAPSVDNGIAGAFGARELLNRLQLTLDSVGISIRGGTGNLLVTAVLNGTPSSTTTWTNAVANTAAPNSSFAQIANYAGGSTVVTGGETIAGFFVGSTDRLDLSSLRDLGNSILGGGGTTSNTQIYPDGPDTLTFVVTNLASATSVDVIGRLNWKEAQA